MWCYWRCHAHGARGWSQTARIDNHGGNLGAGVRMVSGDTGLIHIGPQLPLGITFRIERHGCLELIGILWQSNAVS